MMNRKQSTNMHMLKYVLLIPLVIGCLSIFTISEAKQQQTLIPRALSLATTSTEGTPIENRAPKSDPLAIIDTIKGRDTVSAKKVAITKGEIHIHSRDSIKPLYVIDGEITAEKDLSDIEPTDIESISVIKSEGAVALYGDRGKGGAVLITMKNKASTVKADTVKINEDKLHSALIYIDGEKKTKKDVDALDPEDIDSLEVYKDKAATDKYGNDGKNGVIIITTKQAKSDVN